MASVSYTGITPSKPLAAMTLPTVRGRLQSTNEPPGSPNRLAIFSQDAEAGAAHVRDLPEVDHHRPVAGTDAGLERDLPIHVVGSMDTPDRLCYQDSLVARPVNLNHHVSFALCWLCVYVRAAPQASSSSASIWGISSVDIGWPPIAPGLRRRELAAPDERVELGAEPPMYGTTGVSETSSDWGCLPWRDCRRLEAFGDCPFPGLLSTVPIRRERCRWSAAFSSRD